VYATLGAAAATLLVVGGILVGPSILECSRDAGGFGACLRAKAADNGLIAHDISSEPPPAGWMEAAANEFEAPVSAPIGLEGTRADLVAADATLESGEPIEVAIAPAAELATAALVPSDEAPDVALVAPEGEVSAELAVADAGAGGTAELSQPGGGELTAVAPSQAATQVTIAPEPIDVADELTSAVEPPSSEPAPVELSAEPLPVEPEPSLPSSSEPVSSEPPSSEPVPVVVFNPKYPNVIVLPPPVSGDNSSFRSLKLN
jgi:hypothetical protein